MTLRLRLMHEVAEGLSFLHSSQWFDPVVHLDLKR